ncbi:TIGR02680 family protein [Thermotalea metallivorans]|uniref:Uncharacterized protein n=1 Tax=Thermotalea metallivorans TaxID=520762 RepID=A0A140L4H1_9FIRM|nr:TIGR02680 family protein [Thermotalea metallivorans]KXG75446.1 hypothetical protein AN619_17100 [Thermotalea metallivorans]
MNNRWIINRFGLINFWYYDEEEFHFSNGRLLLRGANGSGKSVTMQSFIPLLLDGNKSPERLDPFGSRARKLENYLLGEDEQGQEERTGYLYMEFVKENTEKYLTIGMGLKARRGKPMEFWGFSVKDGRRIGKDLFLYKDIGEKIPLSKIELKNRIGEGGEVHESQRDYMEMVNKLLFGFDTTEEYDELIKLLIQLRTPKLSKDFKPTVIYDIMNDSLQPLSDDDLRPMSEAIENMDNIKSQLEVLKNSKKAGEKLKNEYDKYNRFILLEKAKDFIKAKEELDEKKKQQKELEMEREQYERQFQEAAENLEDFKLQQKLINEKKRQLEGHDGFKAKQEVDRLERQLIELEQQKKTKEENREKKESKERELAAILRAGEDLEQQQKREIKSKLDEMAEIAENICFHEQFFMEEELSKKIDETYDFTYIKQQMDRYVHQIIQIRRALEQEKNQLVAYDNALEQLENAKKYRDHQYREMEKAERLLLETKEEFIERVHTWAKKNEELKISKETLVEVTRKVHQYGESTTYDDILEELRKTYHDDENRFNKEKLNLEVLRDGQNELLKQKEEELRQWQSQKDPEPERKEQVLRNRERLSREGIPFIPLYQAIDFQNNVPEAFRGILEEALLDMGLLDALIIPKEYREKVFAMDVSMADRYIFSDPKFFQHELSSFLRPEKSDISGVSREEVDNVLKSILLDAEKEGPYINEKGEYGIGLLKGKVTRDYKPKYIGVEARKRFREEMIEKLIGEQGIIQKNIWEIEQKIKTIEERKKVLHNEWIAFPKKEDLETALHYVQGVRLSYESSQKEVARNEGIVEKTYEALKEIRQKIRVLTQKMEIPLNLEAYEEAEKEADLYKNALRELETQHIKLLQQIHKNDLMHRQREDVLEDLDAILYDLGRIERDIKSHEQQLKNCQEQLKLSNYEEIKKEIEECIQILNELPGKIEKEIEKKKQGEVERNHRITRLAEAWEEIQWIEKLYHIFQEGFRQEMALGYVFPYNKDEDIFKAAKQVYQELKGEEKAGKQKEDYTAALQEKYHENVQYLVEYNLFLEHIFHGESEEKDEKIREALRKQRRIEIKGKTQGKDVNFYGLMTFIEEAMKENENLLRESDRQLFEDILTNTISQKIRAKIYHSEQWVKQMNALMESMNTSSGLSFSLVWKSKIKETEEQLDTKELVDLLKLDPRLLSQEDLKKLSRHFRSKILEARKQLEDSGKTQTFHSIMKEILDYRKWFEFRLFFKKTGENRKELTNNAFDRLSGGEKAMAMYVPLFSAVYARYEGARKDCPRIISLDEAFAGVDENNIRDMFRLLEELRLNFVINSQILWGDYDTVPSLSICELVRPNNANFVTVIRYRWNGKVKELLVEEGDLDGKSETA